MRRNGLGVALVLCGLFTGLALWILLQERKDHDMYAGSDMEKEIADQLIGHTVNKKIHRLTCHVLPVAQNRICFTSREEAVNAGFSPCRLCQP